MTDSTSKWAILIGIDKYHESLGSLKYAGADCRILRDTLVSGPLGFPEDQVLLLDDSAEPDRRPTFANIHSFLGSWLAAPKEDDLVFVYFAGHGRLVDGKNYLVPGDATLASIHTLGIPLRHIQDVLESCKARRKLLVLDACHSGAGRDVVAMPGGMAAALAVGTGFYTISSCGAEERSHEWDEVGHGVFSHFLTEALRGGCSPAADGRLTVDSVYEWVHDRVAKWAAQHRCAQTPQRFAQGAGTLVLSESAPDYKALAEQYRREAEEAKARLVETELRKTREQAERDQVAKRMQELQAEALRFVQSNPSLKGAALKAKWRKAARGLPSADAVPDADLDAMILDPHGLLIGNAAEKQSQAEDVATLRIVIVPPDIVERRVYVDDELVHVGSDPIPLPEGTHTIRVVPNSMEWGVEAITRSFTGGRLEKVVIRLRRAESARALTSLALTVLVGCFVSLLGALMPASPRGYGPYVPFGLILCFFIGILYAVILSSVSQAARGVRVHMLPFAVESSGKIVPSLEPPHGLPGLLTIATTYVAWGIGFVVPFRCVFIGWAIGTATLIGIVFCLVPWHGHYRERDVT